MKIVIPYNEILPTRKAHDLYLFQKCYFLSRAEAHVTLLYGQGSYTREALFAHYNLPGSPSLHLHPLPLIRKNNPFNFSWNRPFFSHCQKFIEKEKPDAVILSTLKQADYHFKRKLPKTTYLFEVHELKYYPGQNPDAQEVARERALLHQADKLIVTTRKLEEILRAPPYSLTLPIHHLPLASTVTSLPPPRPAPPLKIGYVGQLYPLQGIDFLLKALAQTPHLHLKVIGGRPSEIAHYKTLARPFLDRVEFLGFQQPKDIPPLLTDVHALVAPFTATGKMPYVAHVKILEYACWGRPLIAPHLDIVTEHFPFTQGLLLYTPDDLSSLIEVLHRDFSKEPPPTATHFSWDTRARSLVALLAR